MVRCRQRTDSGEFDPHSRGGDSAGDSDSDSSMGIPYPMGEDYKMPPREVWEANIRHLVGIMQEYGVPAVPGSSERIEL